MFTKQERLKELIMQEAEYRQKWHSAVKALQDLIDPITDHNQECVKFWEENFGRWDKQIVVMKDFEGLLLTRPKREAASMEAYLPYGIDFEAIPLLDIYKRVYGAE